MSLNDDFLFRATCQKCGMFVDSSYCNEVKGKGYSCIRCGAVCLYDLNQVKDGQMFFVRASHIDGKKKDVGGRITLAYGIEKFIESAGNYGWMVTEYTPITKDGKQPVVKVDTTNSFKPEMVKTGE